VHSTSVRRKWQGDRELFGAAGKEAYTIGAPRVVEGCLTAGREGGYAQAHCAVTKHYSCLTDIGSLYVTHVLCVCSYN
jgi:hypothetical protein